MADKILIVNDTSKLTDLLTVFLKSEGYSVKKTRSKNEALDVCNAYNPDVIIINQENSKWCEEGLCKELSTKSRAGIMVLSCKHTKEALICGYRSGADDYVTMPFDMDVFLVRVEALLRRIKGKSHRRKSPSMEMTFDSFENKVLVDNTVIRFTQTEFRILYHLYLSKRYVTTKELTEKIYGSDQGIPTRTISVHVSKIRKKLEVSGMTSLVLESKYKAGYRLTKV